MFDDLALAATNDTAVLQQLTVANLALTNFVAALTAANKKLVDVTASRPQGALAGIRARTGWPAGSGTAKHPFPGNYCWTHGAQAPVQQGAHKCHLPLQSAGPPQGCNGSKHLGRLGEGQGLGCRAHLPGGDGQCCLLQF